MFKSFKKNFLIFKLVVKALINKGSLYKYKKNYKLRKPSGNHIVGTTRYILEYNTNEKSESKRIIPCICFYPAKDTGEGKQKKYVNEKVLKGAGGINTNSYINAPVCDGKYPLLLFNHGFNLYCEANTIQFEELASHGYIIISIGHIEDGSYELANGEISPTNAKAVSEPVDENFNEEFKKYSEWTQREGKNADIEEHRSRYKRIIDGYPGLVERNEVWIKDSLISLDNFLNGIGQESVKLYDHVDKENIGAFGMSFGGCTALSLTHVSDLIKAVVDLDGFIYSSTWNQPVKKPVMLMQNDVADDRGSLTYPYLIAENDAYLITVEKSKHSNFTDYSEILAENCIIKIMQGDKEVTIPFLGEIDPNKMEIIMNTMLLDFFDKYLKGKNSKVIDTGAVPDEVILVKK